MAVQRRNTTTYGFKPAARLLESRIKSATEQRGFAQTRLLTHWDEVVGPDVAAMARPVNISYSRGGFGATLILLTTGAKAPMVEMMRERIREKVNACYGYAAVARIRVTQTAPTGFAEGQVAFAPQKSPAPEKPRPEVADAARKVAQGVDNDDLRQALSALGARVLARHGK